jgi:hypothetical protein
MKELRDYFFLLWVWNGMERNGMEWIGLDRLTFCYHEIKRLEPLYLNK